MPILKYFLNDQRCKYASKSCINEETICVLIRRHVSPKQISILTEWELKVVFEDHSAKHFPNEKLLLAGLLPQFNLETFRLSEHYKLH